MESFSTYKHVFLFSCIVLLAIIVRVINLDTLPAEMWGDTITHYRLAENIRNGGYFLEFRFGGDGPLFSYLLVFLSLFFGLSFLTIKLTSVVIGIGTTIVTYFLCNEYFKNKTIAYIASFLTAISFWSISFSRQGKPYIMIPFFAALVVLCILKRKKILSGFFVGLGMYSQAGFWGMFLAAFTSIPTFLAALVTSLPFLTTILQHPESMFSKSSYIGEKIHFSRQESIINAVSQVFENLGKNLLSLHVKGDPIFRHNIPFSPHLDQVSGIYFLIGATLIIRLILRERNKILFLYLIVPFFVVQIPSLLDINNPLSTPAMGRMSGIIPFAYSIAAYGIYKTIFSIQSKMLAYSLLTITLGAIGILNINNLFLIYPKTMPNNNTPFGRIIAEEIDTFPLTTNIYIQGCCWGEEGQPEQFSIDYTLQNKRPIEYLNIPYSPIYPSCELLQEKINRQNQFVLFLDPAKQEFAEHIQKCMPYAESTILKKNDEQVARVIKTKK